MSDYLALKGLSDRTEAGAEKDNINVVHKPINQPEPLYITVEWMKQITWWREEKENQNPFMFNSTGKRHLSTSPPSLL